MDLRQLEYVVAVAEEGSFTRAAARCHVVQSALSAQVMRLERELCLKLFARTSRSVRVTPAGERLLPHARALLRGAEAARADLADYAGVATGRLRLGMVGGGVGCRPSLQQALITFHQQHPAVEVSVQDTGSRHMAEQVRDGVLDLATVALYAHQVPAGLVHELLSDEPLVAVVARDHPLASRPTVALGELATAGSFVELAERFGIRVQTDEAFRRVGVERTVAFELGTPDAVLRFVGLGLGVALVPARAAESAADLATLPLDDCPTGHPIGLVHPAPDLLTPSARCFLTLLRQSSAQVPQKVR